VETKSDASPVTEADLRSEEILLDALRREAPDIPVISEERASNSGVPDVGDRFFLVDPLDGTKEFVAGRQEFTTNIAYVEDRQPRFGLVGVPAQSLIYRGLAGHGSHRLEPNAEEYPLKPADGSADPLRMVASRSHADAATAKLVARLRAALTTAGSSLKFCRIAEGNADFYPRFGPTMAWDTAAAQAVVTCAGGQVLTLDGEALTVPPAEDGWQNPAFFVFGRQSGAEREFLLQAAREATKDLA
jgi:3'(2'),5'-bisphosphate nucleotidase